MSETRNVVGDNIVLNVTFENNSNGAVYFGKAINAIVIFTNQKPHVIGGSQAKNAAIMGTVIAPSNVTFECADSVEEIDLYCINAVKP